MASMCNTQIIEDRRCLHSWETYAAVGMIAAATCFHDEPQQPVSVEHEVGRGRGAVADDGVHAADLEVAGDDLQVVEDAPQVVLLQLQRIDSQQSVSTAQKKLWLLHQNILCRRRRLLWVYSNTGYHVSPSS